MIFSEVYFLTGTCTSYENGDNGGAAFHSH